MDMGLFRVTARREGERAVVALAGELDLAGVPRLEEALGEARRAARSLTIDLTDLDFIDSSGLGVLLRFNNAALGDEFVYTVIAAPPPVHRAFVLSGLDHALPFAPLDDDA